MGVISPDDGINDDEYRHFTPESVTLLWTRYRASLAGDPVSIEMVSSYGDLDLIRAAAETLKICRLDAAVLACNSCSFVRGHNADREIREVISDAIGADATTVTHSQIEALKALGVHRVAVGAPYTAEVTDKLRTYLEDAGFEVTEVRALEMLSEWRIGNTPSSIWLETAKEVDSPRAEAILLACSGIRTFDMIERAETEVGKPVVAAPAAVMWHGMRLAGVKTPVEGVGCLLTLL